MSMPSTQMPPFWHGFDWQSLRFTSQNDPPNPAAYVERKKEKKKALFESFLAGFISQSIRISMTLFSQTKAGFQSSYWFKELAGHMQTQLTGSFNHV